MFVLDATTVAAIFDGFPPLIDLWERANHAEITLGVPALAMLEAARLRGIAPSAWDAVLWPVNVQVLDLTERVAAEIGAWEGAAHARHALWESLALNWPVLTRDRRLYATDARVVEI